MKSHITAEAASVGYGVPQLKVSPPKKEPASKIIDLPDDWSDEPTIVNQIADPDLWKPVNEEVKIFDLSDKNQLEEYNKLLTQCNQPNTNRYIRDEKIESFQQTQNWKALVRVVVVKFRKILKTKRDKE